MRLLRMPAYLLLALRHLLAPFDISGIKDVWYQETEISLSHNSVTKRLREGVIPIFAITVFPSQLNSPKYTGVFQSSLQWFKCAACTDISMSQDDKSLHITLKVPQHVGGMRQSQESSPNEPCSLWCFRWIVFLALNEYFRCLMQKKSNSFHLW